MSMIAGYRHLSDHAVRALHADPTLAQAVIDYDPGRSVSGPDVSGPGLPSPIRAMLAQLPPDQRAQIEKDLVQRLEEMGVASLFAERADASGKRLGEAGLGAADFGEPLSIEKAWHGLHYLLARTVWEPAPPPGDAVLGGEPVGDDMGYGPPRLLEPSEVQATAAALGAVAEEALRAGYDGAAMAAAGIYGGHWEDPEELEWVLEAFRDTRAYFGRAAQLGHGMLLFVT